MTQHATSCGTLTPEGFFRQPGYATAPPFSSFLPGIAGLHGKPMWVYYVNRGQAVACFGTRDKDHGIMPFQSALLHCARIEQEGFRTLLRWRDETGAFRGYEPFRAAESAERALTALPWGLLLEEWAEACGLAFSVAYTTLPGEDCAALLRSVTIENRGGLPRTFEWLDGAPMLIPYGLDHQAAQNAPFICQGYLDLRFPSEGLAYFACRDAPSYRHVLAERTEGNFYFAFREDDGRSLPLVVDRDLVFGEGGDLSVPRPFFGGEGPDLVRQKTACMPMAALAYVRSELPPGAKVAVHSVCGAAGTPEAARALLERALQPGWVGRKWAEAERDIEAIRHRFFLHSGDAGLNAYVPQTFLDNVLRGGLPISLEAGDKTHHLHVFNRVHGDLERDYNRFQLAPTFFSQGNGHYRDVNQNRRNDVWFNPRFGAENLRYFFNLLRPDGYNPMECQGRRFQLDDGLEPGAVAGGDEGLAALLAGPFELGVLCDRLGLRGARGPALDEALARVLAHCSPVDAAVFGTGFWIDHWFYCFDLLERFSALFPDRLEEALLLDRSYVYRDDAQRVPGRAERYLLVAEGLIHQVGSPVEDAEKKRLIAGRARDPHLVRTGGEAGAVRRANLLEKIMGLLLNKAASLAPSGLGLEMEAGHPGWHDSINRLPYLFGSSTSELFQLLRAVRMTGALLRGLALPGQRWPAELGAFFEALRAAVDLPGGEPCAYWDAATQAKEVFRASVWMGFSGAEQTVEAQPLKAFLGALERRLESLAARTVDPASGLPRTYYVHRPHRWTVQRDEGGEVLRSRDGYPRVHVEEFAAEPLPLFLEAPVHALRLSRDAEAERLCAALRASPLFDHELKMYLLGDDVSACGAAIGRIGVWPPGWFENENVFLHMEHKLLVSMFESGQFGRLFETMRDVMVPFQPVERYGRSPTENTSFIVSSRHPFPERHGRGYLPRSSGTTAEVLDLFLRLCFGDRPFRMERGELVLELAPCLPGWMFTAEEQERIVVGSDGSRRTVRFPANSFSAQFLGSALVTYHNASRGDTWGARAVVPRRGRLVLRDGSVRAFEGATLRGEWAELVRAGGVGGVEVELG